MALQLLGAVPEELELKFSFSLQAGNFHGFEPAGGLDPHVGLADARIPDANASPVAVHVLRAQLIDMEEALIPIRVNLQGLCFPSKIFHADHVARRT